MDLAGELRALISGPGHVLDSGEELERHSRGYSHYASRVPDAVVFPKSAEDVSAVLCLAGERRIPVVAYGQGSSLEGQVVPVSGGISLDTSLMDAIVELRPEDLVARVQPGIRRLTLNGTLAKYGLFLPPDPGWDASIGGMAATNAAGPNALCYGAMREHVLGLEVGLAGGTLIRTGTLALKSSAGYDLTRLLVGSEGTLGIFTEITLRLHPLPKTVIVARATFGELADAASAAVSLVRSGAGLSRAELMDARTFTAVNTYSETGYPEAPTLLLELSGNGAAVEREAHLARELAATNGCTSFELEEGEEGRARLWEARYRAGIAVRSLSPGKSGVLTDVAVPLSALPAAISAARQSLSHHGFEGSIIAHAGDGNFHTTFPFDPQDDEEIGRARRVEEEIVDFALARGGTCTAEHGVGLGKRDALSREHTAAAVEHMRQIKGLFDPDTILNPGKIF